MSEVFCHLCSNPTEFSGVNNQWGVPYEEQEWVWKCLNPECGTLTFTRPFTMDEVMGRAEFRGSLTPNSPTPTMSPAEKSG